MDQTKPPAQPLIPPEHDTDPDPDRREDALPEHEQDPEGTLGGGVMAAGGTAVDRGTGTLGGRAQGPDELDDREGGPLSGDPDENEPDDTVPTPQSHA